MHERTLSLLGAAVVALALFTASPAQAEKGVQYSWVDENGVVQFGATVPPEYADRPYKIIKNGIVIKVVDDPSAPELTKEQVEAEAARQNPEEAARDLQMKADRLLVLKYRGEQEIIDAMEVEVSNLDYDARLIEQTRTSVLGAINGQIREAADRQRAGLPTDPETRKEISKLRARLMQGQKERDSLDKRENQIREMFLSELRRYRYLINGGVEGEPTPDEPAAAETGGNS